MVKERKGKKKPFLERPVVAKKLPKVKVFAGIKTKKLKFPK